jgi:hypothetical protein
MMHYAEPASGNVIHEVETHDAAPTLEHPESDSGRFRCVALPLLLPGTSLTLQTKNTCYRMVVVDGAERRVRITGGKLFPEGADAQVIGAFDDESIKGGWIVEGYQLELSTPRGPVLTSVVESVDVAS